VEPKGVFAADNESRAGGSGLVIFSFILSYRLKSFDFASPGICSEASRYYMFVYL
jgi:hypothetical protein